MDKQLTQIYMENSTLWKYKKWCLPFLLALLFYNQKSFAQCPTVANPNQDFCAKDERTVTDLAVTDNGGGVRWFDAAIGGIELPSITELTDGITYYAESVTGAPCAIRESVVVSIFGGLPSNTASQISFCTGQNPVINDLPASGTNIEWFTQETGGTALAMNTPLIDGSTYWVQQTENGCVSNRTATGVIISSPAAPLGDSNQFFCNPPIPLVSNLQAFGSNITWYNALGNLVDPSDPLIDGATYFATQTIFGCESINRLAVLVQIDASVEAGTASPFTSCQAAIAPNTQLDLFTQLTGNDTGGVWEDTDATGELVLPSTVNLSNLDDGVYNFTYRMIGNGACPDDIAVVTITIQDSPAPTGTTPQEFCAANNNVVNDLLATGDAIMWYDSLTAGNAYTGTELLVNGQIYYASQTPTAGCESFDRLAVEVILNDPPAPIGDNPQEFCENQNPTIADLVAVGSTIQWYDDATSTTALDPTTALINGEDYFATQTDLNGCQSTNRLQVDVIITPINSAGTPSPFTTCQIDAIAITNFDLFGQLSGHDPGGIWEDTDATGELTLPSFVNISNLDDGTYNFTYRVAGNGTCPEDTAIVTITIQDTPAPTGASPQIFCASANPTIANLVASGANIIWYDTPSNGTAYIGTELLVNGQTYYASQTPTASCESNDRLEVIVNLTDPPTPTGANPQEFCIDQNATVADLSATGANIIWYDEATLTTVLDPTTALINGEDYYATQTDVDGCESTTSLQVIVIITPANEAGTPNPFTTCQIDASTTTNFDLFGQLTGNDSGGVWEDTDASGELTLPSFVNISNLDDGVYNFTYRVIGNGTCPENTAIVTITIEDTPAPTGATPQVFCVSATPTVADLIATGANIIWYNAATNGTPYIGTELLVSGQTYYASQMPAAGCESNDRLEVTVNLTDPPAPTGDSIQEFCIDENATIANLSATGSNIIWYDMLIGGTAYADTDLLIDGTTYYASQTDIDGCESTNRLEVTVTINDTPAPTGDAIQNFCVPEIPTVADLIATGTSIVWYEDATSTSPLDSSTELVEGADYFATQTDAITTCESVNRLQVTVNFEQTVNAGENGTVAFCSTGTPVDLFTILTGTPDTGGVWSPALTSGTGIFDPSVDTAGTYTYTITGVAPCSNDAATVTVTIDIPGNAGNALAQLDVCVDQGSLDLSTGLDGTQDSGGIWTNQDGNTITEIIDISGTLTDTYTYTYSVDGGVCGTDEETITVSITEVADAGTNNSITICVADGVIDLFTQLGGTPDTGGTWSPMLASGTNEFDPEVDAAGIYTYMVSATGGCLQDASATVTITVNDVNSPVFETTDLAFCAEDSPVVEDLNIAVLGLDISWYETEDSDIPLSETEVLVDGEDYFAAQNATNGCESSVRTVVNVSIGDAPTPTVLVSAIDFCINDNPTIQELIAQFENSDQISIFEEETGGEILNLTDILQNEFTYYIALTDPGSGCMSSTRLQFTTNLTDGCENVLVPDGFSPNGDGINDTFAVQNIALIYPNYTIEIFNRYGNILYEGNANSPEWNGVSTGSRTLGDKESAVGVYYYIINYNDGKTSPKQGHLYLSR